MSLKYSNNDVYIDSETGVLKNKLGIRDEQALEAREADIVFLRSLDIRKNGFSGAFDLAHLKAIHKHLFGDIYEWAGCFRTIDLHKGATHFAAHGFLEKAGAELCAFLAREQFLVGLKYDYFGKRLAFYLGELNVLHPFREGNGRAQREFITQLAEHSGYWIHWENMTEKQMLEASIQSFKGENELLHTLILDNMKKLGAKD